MVLDNTSIHKRIGLWYVWLFKTNFIADFWYSKRYILVLNFGKNVQKRGKSEGHLQSKKCHCKFTQVNVKSASHRIAFALLCFTVCFPMISQIACLRGCIITLVAFVQLFSTVYFQMSPQTAYLGEC